ncbi:hypothetical protein [Arachnia rubra]|uniref:hypothetical protein n=1 Tax=Arachnia rubra TaxID=1547448 RepID=UPI001CC581C2|nr:hypothetical protein [Arachnia rubra]
MAETSNACSPLRGLAAAAACALALAGCSPGTAESSSNTGANPGGLDDTSQLASAAPPLAVANTGRGTVPGDG